MKTTKKFVVLCLIAVLAVAVTIPSTFSWYAHSGTTNYQGNEIDYTRESLPLSLQQSNGVSIETYAADQYGKKTGSALSSFGSIAHNSTQRYITTLTNNGSNAVSVDLDMTGITNSTKVYVGTASPVVNEKSFASRATLEKVDWDYEIIYFEPRDHYSWWDNYTAPGSPYKDSQTLVFNDDTITSGGSEVETDMNLEYQVGSGATPMGMEKCPNKDVVTSGSEEYDVYRAFVTTEADSLFFFNHYYITENTNLEWNRTPTVNDFAEGRVYYLNGSTNSYNNKDLSYHDSFNDTNICVYYYYKTATMAIGKTADIGLSQGTKDMIGTGETYDYLGKSISYAVKSGSSKNSSGTTVSDSNIISVSKDGLITAKAAGTATITTTITGEFGDTLTLETKVNVPSTISQVPVAHNIEVPAGKSVDVTWYVKNTDDTNSASFSNVFFNI